MEKLHVLEDRYKLIELLHKGSFAEVWKAQDNLLSLHTGDGPASGFLHIAIKVLREEFADDPEMLPRFLRDAKTLANLRGPHIPQILYYGIDDGTAFFVMELLEGEDLESHLAKRGPFSLRDTCVLARHIAVAIDRVHVAGIVHRNLKPANIFLRRIERQVSGYVTGFLLSRGPRPPSQESEPAIVVGTSRYQSPEQLKGAEATAASDIWSLGVIVFEMLTGRCPYDVPGDFEGLVAAVHSSPPVLSRLGTCPPSLDEWFSRACALSPKDRFVSARELGDALARVASEVPASSQAPGSQGFLLVEPPSQLGRSARSLLDESRLAVLPSTPPKATGATSGVPSTTPSGQPVASVRREPIQRGSSAVAQGLGRPGSVPYGNGGEAPGACSLPPGPGSALGVGGAATRPEDTSHSSARRGLMLWLTCNGERHCITKDDFTIGSSEKSDVRIQGADVKQVQAIIQRSGGVFVLYDFSGVGGTKQGESGVPGYAVRDGATHRIGHCDLEFSFGWCPEGCGASV